MDNLMDQFADDPDMQEAMQEFMADSMDVDDVDDMEMDESAFDQDYTHKRGWLDEEDREDYRPGGFHPVIIGDILNSRYRVLHKLGCGGLSTVWLARDMNSESSKYVALKVVKADASGEDSGELRFLRTNLDFGKEGGEYIVKTQDYFFHRGPNGKHLCLVLPVLGPRVRAIWAIFEDPHTIARDLARQVSLGLRFLHRNGIAHGDLRSDNILLCLKDLDSLSEAELSEKFGETVKESLVRVDGGEIGPSAPAYLVQAVDLEQLGRPYLMNQACIINLGKSYDIQNPPKELNVRASIRSPELLLDNTIGPASDIWALACTIYDVRAHGDLFDDFMDDDNDVIMQIVQMLGKLPEPLWSKWEGRSQWFEEDGSSLLDEDEDPLVKSLTIADLLAKGVHITYHPVDGESKKSLDIVVPAEEARSLVDLLLSMLKYDPKERANIEEVLEHPWFKR